MLKVLVVDDEPIIREGLRTIIDWAEYGFEICAEAVNGKDGMIKARELKPDLIIVDIKMPGMDGLQMIEEIKKMGNRSRVIILTGYSDFKYAQKGIEFGVESYVLKPIEEDELIERVTKVFQSLMEEKKGREVISESMVLFREKMIEKLIRGPKNIESFIEKAVSLGLELQWSSFQLVLIAIEIGEDSLKEKVKTELTDQLCRNGNGYAFELDGYTGTLMKNSPFAVNSGPLEVLTNRFKAVYKTDITIAVGPGVERVQDIPASYKLVYRLMEDRFVHGTGKILRYEILENDTEKKGRAPDLKKWMEALYAAVYANNRGNILSVLEEIGSQNVGEGHSEKIIKMNMAQVFTYISGRLEMEDKALWDTLKWKRDPLTDMREVHSKTNLQQLLEYSHSRLTALSDEIAKSRPDDVMLKILDYILKNYQRDIKLETIAQTFNYNSAYLGKLFKGYTGEYFNTYLDKVRVEKAKQFLKEDFKIYQIAEKVGYDNINYFNSKFKKYVGVSPSAYKKIHKGGMD